MAITATAATAAMQTAERTALKQAGQEFEALLLEKLLRSSHATQTGPAADWRALADRQLARDLAATSPLGIAKLLEPKP